MIKLFTAKWCANCKPMKELLNDLELDYETVDVSVGHVEAEKYSVRGLPTIMAFDSSGTVLGRMVGNVSVTQVKSFFNTYG